jgi:hypothetical protein
MRGRLVLSMVAVFALATTGLAFTPDDSFEFNSSDDLLSGNAQTEADFPASRADSGGSVSLVTPDPSGDTDGYLEMVSNGAKESQEYSILPPVSNANGWTVEIKCRFDKAGDYVGFDKKGFNLRVKDGTERSYIFIGNSDGVNVVGQDPEFSATSGDTEEGMASWTRDGGGIVIDETADWHVYRMVYDPADVGQEAEVYVDGTMVTKSPGRPDTGASYLKWGPQKSNDNNVIVHVDYIRWADDVIERPGDVGYTGPTGYVSPAIENATFDVISDPDHDIGAIPAVPAAWQIQNISGPGAFPLEHGYVWRCDAYGKALRLQEGQAYDAVVKQSFTAEAGQTANFEAQMRAYTASCTQIQGRVGIDPAGSGCDPAAGSIVWSDWTDLYDTDLCSGINCVTLSTSATMTGTDGCVFIETNAPSSPGDEQSTFMDSAVLELVNACNTPPQDADGDGDVDLSDYGDFLNCYNGPENSWPNLPGNDVICPCMDSDHDADVDLTDYGAFLDCYNGPTNPPNC